MRKNQNYKVEVQNFADRPRQVVVWKRGEIGWLWAQAMAIPEDIDGAWLEADVLRRLTETV